MKHFFWVDLEMTGLDDLKDHILEVAVVITGIDLKPIEEYHRVVFQPKEVLDLMDDWCKKTHGASGLTAAVPTGTPLAQVETELLALVEKYYTPNERVVLVGNSVGNDKRFLDRYMLKLAPRPALPPDRRELVQRNLPREMGHSSPEKEQPPSRRRYPRVDQGARDLPFLFQGV